MTTAVISAPRVADHPQIGGHFWEYMQYAHALRVLGCDVWWLERIRFEGDPSHGVGEDLWTRLSTFMRWMEGFDFSDRVLLYTSPEPGAARPYGPWQPITSSASRAEEIVRRADILLNWDYGIDEEVLAMFRRTALIDIDPGLFQFWLSEGQLRVPRHDLYFTTGETVGRPGSRFTDCGLPWIHMRPGVALDLWPYVGRDGGETYTTVSSWWGDEWITDGVDYYENNKRVTFMEFWDLPARSGRPMELALNLGPGDEEDIAKLHAGGWRVRNAREVASSPFSYRKYLQASRGEFSCVKPSCIRFANAWISDRTLCYLASGKPAIIQDTGPSRLLPNGEGMFRFSTMQEAIAALAAVDADYRRQSRAAREVAEAFFDAVDVMRDVLDTALAPARKGAIDEAQPGQDDAVVAARGRLDGTADP